MLSPWLHIITVHCYIQLSAHTLIILSRLLLPQPLCPPPFSKGLCYIFGVCQTFRQLSGTGYNIKSSFSSGQCTLASVHPFIRYHDKGIDNKERNLTDKGYLMCGTHWGATLPVALCPQAVRVHAMDRLWWISARQLRDDPY